jgi:hypothetical protein
MEPNISNATITNNTTEPLVLVVEFNDVGSTLTILNSTITGNTGQSCWWNLKETQQWGTSFYQP